MIFAHTEFLLMRVSYTNSSYSRLSYTMTQLLEEGEKQHTLRVKCSDGASLLPLATTSEYEKMQGEMSFCMILLSTEISYREDSHPTSSESRRG